MIFLSKLLINSDLRIVKYGISFTLLYFRKYFNSGSWINLLFNSLVFLMGTKQLLKSNSEFYDYE